MTTPSETPHLFATSACDLGMILVTRPTDHDALSGIFLGPSRDAVLAEFRTSVPATDIAETPSDPRLIDALASLMSPTEAGLARIPLLLEGTAFQKRVWLALREIPIGETRTYSELALHLGLATGARAVARACAKNRHALAIPCHRIIRADGSLSGYRWGIERKRALLERERGIKEAREDLTSRAA